MWLLCDRLVIYLCVRACVRVYVTAVGGEAEWAVTWPRRIVADVTLLNTRFVPQQLQAYLCCGRSGTGSGRRPHTCGSPCRCNCTKRLHWSVADVSVC